MIVSPNVYECMFLVWISTMYVYTLTLVVSEKIISIINCFCLKNVDHMTSHMVIYVDHFQTTSYKTIKLIVCSNVYISTLSLVWILFMNVHIRSLFVLKCALAYTYYMYVWNMTPNHIQPTYNVNSEVDCGVQTA